MRFKIIAIAIAIGLANQSSQAENVCTKDGGRNECVEPMLSPWTYSFTICDTNHGYFNTEDEAIAESIKTYFYNYTNARVEKDYGWGTLQNPTWGPCGASWPVPYITFNYNHNYEVHNNKQVLISYDISDSYRSNTYVTVFRDRKATCPKSVTDYRLNMGGWNDLCVVEKPIKKACESTVGNPCSVTTGNKSQSETDWTNSNSPLKVTRTYNSLIPSNHPTWTFNHTAQLDIGQVTDNDFNLASQSLQEDNSIIRLTRSDGSRIIAQRNFTDTTVVGNTVWFIDRDMGLQLIKIDDSTWQVKNVRTGTIETYQAITTKPTSADSTTSTTSSTQATTDNTKLVLSRVDYLNGQFITYTSSNGQITSATDNLGNTLTYQYTNGVLTQIQLPDGNTIQYGYDILGRLVTVQRPGYGIKTYVYAEADKDPSGNPYLLTGIIDENGVRYANYAYDSQNRGILTEHAGGAQRYILNYSDNNTQVTDDHGSSRSYDLTTVSGSHRISHLINGTQDTTNQYDQGGNLTSETKNGITTKYTYDVTRNLETSRIDAYGTASSKITLTEWDANKPLKTKITEGSADSNGNLSQALRVTSYTYDNQGNPLTKTITDPKTNQSRTWTYTYNANSQKLSETNPQGQVSQWAYDNKGFLVSSTDSQGLVTTYSDLNADGKPQTITSPTGQVTKLTYDGAGRVLTQTTTVTNPSLADISQNTSALSGIINAIWSVFGASPNVSKFDISHDSSQVATTSYQYDGVGQLIQTTLPDGQIISYQYDDAHRLIGMTDSLGNKISYTLNAAGDIIQTDSKDSTGQLAQSSKQSFDTLGRLSAQTGNNGQQDSFTYDNQDNLTQSSDALSRTNQNQYDTLKRKIQSTDALGGKSSSTYNAIDQLTSQTDAKGVVTTYNYNAFGDLLSTSSPDTLTYNYSYNAAGQLTSQSDGSGRQQTYTYDDKGRLTQRTDAAGKSLVQYTYDSAGRIASFTDTSGSTAYQYNSQNQVVEKKQTTEGNTLTTRYHYTAGGQLDQVLLPSGQLVQYQYNQGVLKGIQVKTNNNQTVQLVDNLKYNPNGITGYTWGQTGQAVSYRYDLDGRLTNISDNAFNRSYSYDAGNRITNLTDPTANIAGVFTHDKLDRLLTQNFNQGQDKYDYAYDANSNRYFDDHYTPTSGNASSLVYPAGNNLNMAYSYDGSGKVTSDWERSYSYNSEGRIERIQKGSVGIYNAYNALGQRVQKNSGNAKTYFLYDESGALAGEYDGSGTVLREYVYLAGRPIAMLSGEKPNQVLQVHSDHLGTPRAVSDATNAVLWRWEGDAFGTSSPQLATVNMPLRMAGQYADDETGLFYNYFRFYDPKTGRYVENDPIGLAGGMNRWAYVGGSPLHMVDPRGQNAVAIGALAIGELTLICYQTGTCQKISDGFRIWMANLSKINDQVIDNPKTIEEFCNKCQATDTRSAAQAKAYEYAGMSMYEGMPLPWINFNPPYGSSFRNGRIWADYMRKYYPPFYGEATDTGQVEEHPFGHPDLTGGKNHECPHFLAKRAGMEDMEFPYKPGSF